MCLSMAKIADKNSLMSVVGLLFDNKSLKLLHGQDRGHCTQVLAAYCTDRTEGIVPRPWMLTAQTAQKALCPGHGSLLHRQDRGPCAQALAAYCTDRTEGLVPRSWQLTAQTAQKAMFLGLGHLWQLVQYSKCKRPPLQNYSIDFFNGEIYNNQHEVICVKYIVQ